MKCAMNYFKTIEGHCVFVRVHGIDLFLLLALSALQLLIDCVICTGRRTGRRGLSASGQPEM